MSTAAGPSSPAEAAGPVTIEQRLQRFRGGEPRLAPDVYLAPGAVVVGDVEVGEASSIWFHAVLRGDINAIRVGHHTNIQDGAILHVADDFACRVGSWVTVGHGAVVHACRVGDEVLVGMRAVILDGAEVGARSIIAAGAVVTPGMVVPEGSMVMGMPARVVRPLTPSEQARLRHWAEKYVANAAYCRRPTAPG